MERLERLKAAVIMAQDEDDLPDALADRIFAIIERLEGCDLPSLQLDELHDQLLIYDAYAQTGYIGMGVDDKILEFTIRRLEEKLVGC